MVMYSAEILGKNIKQIRLERNMTQAQLAQKLHITSQNISKWENGLCLPDVNNLCLLATALEVTTDRLLGKTDGIGAMIAIDGGGTKTEFCLFGSDGEVLRRSLAGSSNPNAVGMDTTLKILKSGIDELLAAQPTLEAIFAGVAGCGIEKNRRAVKSYLQSCYPNTKILVNGDIINVIYSEDYYDECIVAIMGTGSVITAKRNDEIHRIGGWGYLFDEGYSGFGLGRDAVVAALAQEDGIGDETVLTKLLSEKLGGGIINSIDLLYSDNNARIASYAELVFKAYDMGDAVARRIVEKRQRELYRSLIHAYELYGIKHVVLAGGLSGRRDIIDHFMSDAPFDIHFPTLPPIYGACRYCALSVGKISADFGEKFKLTYTK